MTTTEERQLKEQYKNIKDNLKRKETDEEIENILTETFKENGISKIINEYKKELEVEEIEKYNNLIFHFDNNVGRSCWYSTLKSLSTFKNYKLNTYKEGDENYNNVKKYLQKLKIINRMKKGSDITYFLSNTVERRNSKVQEVQRTFVLYYSPHNNLKTSFVEVRYDDIKNRDRIILKEKSYLYYLKGYFKGKDYYEQDDNIDSIIFNY